MLRIELSHLFAFAVSKTDFYSLANFFRAKREFNGIIHVQPSVFRIVSHEESCCRGITL